MSWSPQQADALSAVGSWLKSPGDRQVFRLFGYAGTGKTTLAKEFAAGLDGAVMFGAFTGKAAHVMRKKGCAGASTIHSMIYRLDDDQPSLQPRFSLNAMSAVKEAALVIIDECSMVDEKLGADLLSFGTPVLVLGDPEQLPPVGGEGFFTNAKPDVMLTDIHRQAAQSPIIRLATSVRQGERPQIGSDGECDVISYADVTSELVLSADQVLVGRNITRHKFNARLRSLKGFSGDIPNVGEKLVCLRNDKEKRLFNGSIWTVTDVKTRGRIDRVSGTTRLSVLSEDAGPRTRPVDVIVKNEFWTGNEGQLEWSDKRGTQEFTYGYALTTHKSQGSQWENVVVFDESATFREDAPRWLYTAITRAAKKLTVVVQ